MADPAPTIPPDSQPPTPQINVPPAAPFTNQTIDPNFAAISAQQKSFQRLIYELNEDLFRATVVVPLDVNVAAQEVVELQEAYQRGSRNPRPSNPLAFRRRYSA